MHERAEEAVDTVKYEQNMFVLLTREMKVKTGKAIEFERNVLLECFLLHTRILRDFLTTHEKNRKMDDIIACDFFDNPAEWEEQMSGLCQYSTDNRIRMNKKLQHLTYARLDEEDGWCCPTIRVEIDEAWEAFLLALPDDRRNWFG